MAKQGLQAKFRPSQRAVALAAITVHMVTFTVDIWAPLGIAGGVPHVIGVLFAMWSTSSNDVWHAAWVGTILTIAGYLLSPAAPFDGQGIVIVNRLIAIGAIWGTALAAFLYHQSQAELAFVSTLSPVKWSWTYAVIQVWSEPMDR